MTSATPRDPSPKPGARQGTKTKRWLANSLSTRIAFTFSAVLLLVLGLFSFWVATQLRSELFEARVEAVLEDASVRFSQAQTSLDQAVVSTPDQVQEATETVLNSILESAAGAGAIEVALLSSPSSSSTFRINEFLGAVTTDVISDEIRGLLTHEDGYWQSVGFTMDEKEEPGILVGALVDLPLAGTYQMFILYSLEAEQSALTLLSHVLLWGAIPILTIMSIVASFMIHRMLRPVRTASQAATKIAEGDLDSRIDDQGRDEMAQLGRAFNEMAASLSDQLTEYDSLSRMQQGFVSDVSHELRTPMTTIRMAEEMIYKEREDLSSAGRRSAELLHSEAERFEEMLADLLEISRYDARSAKLDGESTDIYTLVTKTVKATGGLADQLGVEVQVGPRPEKCSIPVDPKRLERVVRNLLVNAYEHAEGKPVEVRVVSGGSSVAIGVRDHGVGMDFETSRRVFDRFYRADPARARTTGGTGLGLAIAKEDIELHNGVIAVAGELGEGSSFVVTLPRVALTAVTEFPLKVWEDK